MNKFLNNAVIYQIYPITFFDGNDDGKGDFKGMTEKLGYLNELGVNVLWLSPIFPSPFRDGGYDVTDFREINPDFGTKEEFKDFLRVAHEYNMRVLIDFTIGHTSVDSEWFKQSQKNERNKYSDYYIWTNGWWQSQGEMLKGVSERDGCVATNYYSHQIALNYGYENPDKDWQMDYKDERLKPLRDEIIDILQEWLLFGVDGFRIDLAPSVIKNRTTEQPLIWFWNQVIPNVKKVNPHAIFLAEWGDPSLSVGECGFDSDYLTHEDKEYNELLRNEANTNVLPFLEKGDSYFRCTGKGNIENFLNLTSGIIDRVQGKGYYTLPSGYHDIPRISVNRDVDDLKVFFAFMLSYKTLPLIYYGDEIGLSYNPKLSKDGGYCRTGARTPMQWNNDKNRGFSKHDIPYLPTNTVNEEDVETQKTEEKSLWNTVKKLLTIRKENSSLWFDANLRVIENSYPLIFERGMGERKITVIINPSSNVYERNAGVKKILVKNNCEVLNDKIYLQAKSFIIFYGDLT